MYGHHDSTAPRGLRAWWASPPRSGLRRIISPVEYRHLRGFARLRIVSGGVLTSLGVITLAVGGNDTRTYGWASVFLAIAAANLAFARWELMIASHG